MGGYSDMIGSAMQMGLSMGQAKSDPDTDAYAARQAALNAQYEEQQRHRKNLLEAQMASQRARLAAAGIGSSGGSGDAILRGMASRSASDQTAAANLYGLQSSVLSNQAAASRASSSAGLERMLMGYGGSLLDSWGGGNSGGMMAADGASMFMEDGSWMAM